MVELGTAMVSGWPYHHKLSGAIIYYHILYHHVLQCIINQLSTLINGIYSATSRNSDPVDRVASKTIPHSSIMYILSDWISVDLVALKAIIHQSCREIH